MKTLLALLILLAGCGYQFGGGQLPGEVSRLYLPLATNLTTEPLLENLLAPPVTAVLARQQGVIMVESRAASEATLQGVISSYAVEPLSYDSNDRISEYQITLKVHYELKKSTTGRLLWQGEFSRQQSYRAAIDKNQQEDLESQAQEAIMDDLADDLLNRLVTRF